MRQLLYISNTSAEFPEDALDDILAAARRNNAARDVTGMLLYLDGAFLQVLEGPSEGVEKIYARIRRDERHWGAETLLDSPKAPRAFANWSMGFRKLKPGEADTDQAFRITREAMAERWTDDAAIEIKTLMQTFYSAQTGDRTAA
jgi:Sensors of blue-light using FAD